MCNDFYILIQKQNEKRIKEKNYWASWDKKGSF